jgi:mono/diheme cytochrome c family protein
LRGPGLPWTLAFAALLVACAPGGGQAPVGRASGEGTVLVDVWEKAGEAIYRRENCARCHTLYDSPPGVGPIDLPGPLPAAGWWGSRVGPDLGLEGHRRSDDWQYAHLYAPALVVRDSRMPPSRHLFRPGVGRPVPTEEALQLVAYLQALGRGRRDIWAEWRSREPEIPAPPPADEALLARGAALYAEHCASCHGGSGDGRGEAAALLTFPPRDFGAGHYRFKSTAGSASPTDADLFRMITLGTGTGSAMPGYYWLPARDRWSLVLRIKEFSPPLRGLTLHAPPETPAPAPPLAEGDGAGGIVEAGRTSWASLGCTACHGEDGGGMATGTGHGAWTDQAGVRVPRSGDLRHACGIRGGASAAAMGRAIVLGVGTAMPAYGDALADEASRHALVAFLEALRGNATSPGTPDRPSPIRTPGR